ncbi:endothelin-converting enzyme homolog [Chrysoperla carnea]|uniref:endothelin-converting enzyme homolog n=1 Tax=Chrysoperla carnea TaxID=189513 RepID=UPI001D089596|nr:endothelin-converting enzyme homolog [Chrysoperla carnea]
MSQFSSKQLFFISFAKTFCEKITTEALLASITTDPHTTNEFRVIGAVSNSKEFAEVFNCNKNSQMNPINKCILW